jgi:CO/xanthine dehydrogenase FAD-binding subunit
MGYRLRLPKFEYLAPSNTAEVCKLLASYAGEAKLLAGGTDLILQMRRRDSTPRLVVGLKRIKELQFISERPDGGLAIGSMTTIHALLSSPLLHGRWSVLPQTAGGMGSPEIRYSATIGGNLAGALPCADFPPALITLGARVKLQSHTGERWIPVEEFFPGCGQTVAATDELLTEIQIPAPPPSSGGAYLKFHDRHSMDMTTAGVSALVVRDAQSRLIRYARIGLASSAPIPMRARRAETFLRGQPFEEKVLAEAARLVCEEADPRTSWRATREFRRELLQTLTKRALTQAWEIAVASTHGGRS